MTTPAAAERERSAERWGSLPAPSEAKDPVVAPTGGKVLPLAADGGAKITVFNKREVSPASGRRRLRAVLSFLVIVALPVVLGGVHLFFVAADQYVAEFRFALRTAEPEPRIPTAFFQESPAPILTLLDSYIVAQYLASRAVVDELDPTLDLRTMFSRPEADWLARLDLPVSAEELVKYWKRQVDAFFDATNGTIVVRARAFTRQDALTLAEAVLAASERLVNELSARARRDTLRTAKEEVGRAERRLKSALAQLRDFRDREGLIDPRKTAEATSALAGRVRDELVRADTELATLKHYMRDDAPSVKMLEARIQSLQAQQRSVESEVTDTERTRSEALSRVMGSYEQLEAERTFAENAYQHALQALDRARMNAERQQVYLASFVPPTLPEKALYPRRVLSLIVVFVIAFGVWGIGGLMFRSLRDHLHP